MELVSIRRAAVIFYVQLELTNPFRKAKDRELTELLIKRYGFLKFPRTFAEYNDDENGVLFGDGAYDGFEVQTLRIFPNGFLIETGESTDLAERFFGDIVSVWQGAGLNLTPDMVTAKEYISQLAVKSDIDLVAINPAIDAVIKNWFPTRSGVATVGIYLDDKIEVLPVRIDRLAGVPLESMQFWSQAPLSTNLHLSFLERWETVLRESTRPSSATEPAPQP